MKRYKPIKIFHIKYGYGWWFGNYFFFIGKGSTMFGIMPMFMEFHCSEYVGKHEHFAILDGDTCSWSESRQKELKKI